MTMVARAGAAASVLVEVAVDVTVEDVRKLKPKSILLRHASPF